MLILRTLGNQHHAAWSPSQSPRNTACEIYIHSSSQSITHNAKSSENCKLYHEFGDNIHLGEKYAPYHEKGVYSFDVSYPVSLQKDQCMWLWGTGPDPTESIKYYLGYNQITFLKYRFQIPKHI